MPISWRPYNHKFSAIAIEEDSDLLLELARQDLGQITFVRHESPGDALEDHLKALDWIEERFGVVCGVVRTQRHNPAIC